MSAQQRAESEQEFLWEMPNLGQSITFCTDLSKNTTIPLISRSNLEVWCLGVGRTSISFLSSGHGGYCIWGWGVIAHLC